MTKDAKPLDQEKLLLTLEQLQITLDQVHANIEQIIQINLVRHGLLENRMKELERLQAESCDRASQPTGDSL